MDVQSKVHGKGDFPEGFDVTGLIRDLSDEVGYTSVIDFGCGHGRMCQSFDPKAYLGVDVDLHSIEQARKKFSEYRFDHLQEKVHCADLYLACNVFLHMSDQSIHEALKNIRCKWLILVEMLGRNWRAGQVPPTYNRELSEYLELLRSHDLILHKHIKQPFKKYSDTSWYQDRNTDLSFIVFKKCFRSP
jgi:hypothetical protein